MPRYISSTFIPDTHCRVSDLLQRPGELSNGAFASAEAVRQALANGRLTSVALSPKGEFLHIDAKEWFADDFYSLVRAGDPVPGDPVLIEKCGDTAGSVRFVKEELVVLVPLAELAADHSRVQIDAAEYPLLAFLNKVAGRLDVGRVRDEDINYVMEEITTALNEDAAMPEERRMLPGLGEATKSLKRSMATMLRHTSQMKGGAKRQKRSADN